MRPRIVVQLKGGLGNQLFQYAMATSLARTVGADLAIDEHTGFARDRRFRRTYELGAFSVRGRPATVPERMVSGADALLKPLRPRRSQAVRRSPWADFITEPAQRFLPEAASWPIRRLTFIKGYWQSPRYFERFEDQLRQELQPALPADPAVRRLGQEMEATESIAVGVRLYEEDRNPAANARDGRTKSLAEQGWALARLLGDRPDAKVYVFCTHRSPQLAELAAPPGTRYLTGDEGFVGAVPNLWLMTRCRHHVFNNSSFYWWGAWLGQGRHPGGPGRVCAADNFVNLDALPDAWERF